MSKRRKVLGRSEKQPHRLQRNSDYYLTPKYLSPERMSSYGHQYNLAMNTGCSSFLNVGSANWILHSLLFKQGKFVSDLDIDLSTTPDVIGSIVNLPLKDFSFEVVMCYQVLEHLPFFTFEQSLRELRRVSSKFIIISLPDRSLSRFEKAKRFLYILVRNPRNLHLLRKKIIDPEHFWEIGRNGVTLDRVLNVFLDLNIKILSHFRNRHFDYHHFFLLEK